MSDYTDKDTYYLHWAFTHALVNSVELLEKHINVRNVDNDEVNILLTVSSYTKSDLVEVLLGSGSSPNERIKVERRPSSEAQDISGSIKVSIWMVFLRLVAVVGLESKPAALHEYQLRRFHGHSSVLEQFLRFGVDRDVYFLGYLETLEVLNSEAGTRPFDYNPTDEDLFYIDRHQLLQLFQPENLDSLQKLLIGSVGHQVWNKTTSMLAGLTPWGASSPSTRTKYRPANLDQLRQTEWRVHGVVSKTEQLLGGFQYRLY